MIVSAAAIAFALLLGTFIFLVLPRGRQWQRAASVSLFLALIVVVYDGSLELLSRPKPLRLELRQQADKAKVVAATMHQGEAIYVWLEFPGSDEPRAYALPWNIQMAQQLQTAMADAQAKGTAVQMTMPFEPGLDSREPKFYAAPQPTLPPKNYQDPGGLLYRQPDGSS